ncbi:leucine-rich repeat-containing protein 15-like isoform X3 [Montipora capricornis]|uniref:leucine-rich repeat-containing protein 15-like isoform X3 n=1 Tax=Montipora capricornis TaxID=246305 RepID=UPI0035F165A5
MLLAFTLLPILAILASAQAITDCSVAEHMKVNSTVVNLTDNGCKTFWSEPCNKTEIITELWLSNNKIETLNSNMFTCLKNLEKLYLQRNLITNIQRNTFSGLTKLKQLYLNRNNIKTITPWAFDNCSLITLSLEYNQLLDLPVFGRETDIRHLEMTGNPIKKLDVATLAMYTNLERLYIGETNIAELPGLVFEKNKKLKELYLQRNLITNIERNTFSGLTKLKQLNLNGNRIKTITPWAFDNCSLITLSLEYNQLLELPVFGRETEIRHLEMTGNPIKKLDVATLAMHTNLHRLHIGETNIAELPGLVFEKNKKLMEL